MPRKSCSQKLIQSNLPYIKPELINNVHTYKPQSSCFSLYYNYILSPFCDWLVTLFPTWLAPNVITLTGFFFNVFTHLWMLYKYGTSTEGPFDSWFCDIIGVSYTIYNILDNSDGK